MTIYTILLEGSSLISPEPGLLLWTAIIFVILWVLLGKFAFKPIGKALRDRENSIEDALKTAEKARDEMAAMTAKNEELIKEAKEERSKILREAKETKDSIVAEAKDKAREEAAKIVDDARRDIDNLKMAALTEVKNEVGAMAIDIAEKILRKELSGKQEHQAYISTLIKDTSLN